MTAVSFRYGQRHTRELTSAENVCRHYGVRHVVIDLDLSSYRSALTRKDIDVPLDREGDLSGEIPITYVPARNIVFLSIAAGLCESVDADRIYIGANAVDYSGYPDCRPEFFEAYQEMLAKGTKAGVEGHPISVVTPILHSTKADIVRLGKRLGAPLELTWSCYNGGDKACGHCDSCRLRLKGFEEAGYRDEIEYEYDENLRDIQVGSGRGAPDGAPDGVRQDRGLQPPLLLVRHPLLLRGRDRNVPRGHSLGGRGLPPRLPDRRGAPAPARRRRADWDAGRPWEAGRSGDQRLRGHLRGSGRPARPDKHGRQMPLLGHGGRDAAPQRRPSEAQGPAQVRHRGRRRPGLRSGLRQKPRSGHQRDIRSGRRDRRDAAPRREGSGRGPGRQGPASAAQGDLG